MALDAPSEPEDGAASPTSSIRNMSVPFVVTPVTPSTMEKRKSASKSALAKVKHTYQKAISYNKRVQRLFMLSSIILAIVDLASDWSVAINYLIQSSDSSLSGEERSTSTTYGVIFVLFIGFHGGVSLLYHVFESRELRAQKKLLSSPTTLDAAASHSAQTPVAPNSTSVASFPSVTSLNSPSNALSADGSQTAQMSQIERIQSNNSEAEIAVERQDSDNIGNVDVSKFVVTETDAWQYPFFLIGLGPVAAVGNCFKLGTTDQLWEETRYFEVLMESLPIGCITFYVFLEQRAYDEVLLFVSLAITVLSIGYGTGWYFSRHYAKGNPLEFKALVESSYLHVELGLLTSLDYIVRVVSPLLLIRSKTLSKNSPLGVPLLFLFIVFAVPEMIAITCIHGSFAKFGGPFGWFATFSVSVPIFAGIATRFERYAAFWLEVIARDVINIACIAMAVYLDDDNKESNDLKTWFWISICGTVVSKAMTIHLVILCKRVIDELPLPREKSFLGTRTNSLPVQG